MPLLVDYLQSFRFKKEEVFTFLFELFLIALVALLWFGFNGIIEQRLYAVTGGQSIDALKSSLLASTEGAAQAFLGNVKLFTYVFVIGIVVMLLLTFLLFAFSQYHSWARLLHQKISLKAIPRWCGLFSLLLLFGAGFLIIYLAFFLLLSFILPATGTLTQIVLAVSKSFFLVLILAWTTFVFYFFSEKKQMLESLHAAFSWIKKNRRTFWPVFLLAVLTFIILNLLVVYLQQKVWISASAVENFLIKIFLLTLYYNWLRLYLLKTVKKKESTLS